MKLPLILTALLVPLNHGFRVLPSNIVLNWLPSLAGNAETQLVAARGNPVAITATLSVEYPAFFATDAK